jgi:hypothetical protein
MATELYPHIEIQDKEKRRIREEGRPYGQLGDSIVSHRRQ